MKDKKSIILLNKIDLPNKFSTSYIQSLIGDKLIIETSVAYGIGVEVLEKSIKDMFYSGEVEIHSDTVITNLRHKNQLEKALENINSALNDIRNYIPIDCIEVDLKNCWDNLGEISGETIDEDILDKIFSEFCIGK